MKVTRGAVERTAEASAEIESATVIPVRAPVSGVLASSAVERGARVEKGQPLVVIDGERFKEKVALAEQRRASPSGQRDREELLPGELPMLGPSHHAIAQAEAALVAARLELEQSTVRSPVDGVVVSRLPHPGEAIAGGPDSPPLCLISPGSADLMLRAGLDDDALKLLAVGQEVPVFVEGQREVGTLTAVDRSGHNIVVRLANPGTKMLPGQSGRVRVTAERLDNVLRIPRAALFLAGGRDVQRRGIAWRLKRGNVEPVGVGPGRRQRRAGGDPRWGARRGRRDRRRRRLTKRWNRGEP